MKKTRLTVEPAALDAFEGAEGVGVCPALDVDESLRAAVIDGYVEHRDAVTLLQQGVPHLLLPARAGRLAAAHTFTFTFYNSPVTQSMIEVIWDSRVYEREFSGKRSKHKYELRGCCEEAVEVDEEMLSRKRGCCDTV